MSKSKIPKWARRAIFSHRPHAPAFSTMRNPEAVARHKAVWRLFLKRWHELGEKGGFLQAVSGLPDLGKQYIFDAAVGVLRSGPHLSMMRSDRDEVSRLNQEIMRTATALAVLMRTTEQLRARSALNGAPPGLWELLEDACAYYPDWASVCADERKDFLRIAQSQSRPGPRLVDVLEALAGSNWDPAEVDYDYPFNVALYQKRTSAGDDDGTDKLRLLIHQLGNLHHEDIPRGFDLTDAALANLANVLFDRNTKEDGGFNAEGIRGLRRRMVDESLVLNGSESMRRFSVLRY